MNIFWLKVCHHLHICRIHFVRGTLVTHIYDDPLPKYPHQTYNICTSLWKILLVLKKTIREQCDVLELNLCLKSFIFSGGRNAINVFHELLKLGHKWFIASRGHRLHHSQTQWTMLYLFPDSI